MSKVKFMVILLTITIMMSNITLGSEYDVTHTIERRDNLDTKYEYDLSQGDIVKSDDIPMVRNEEGTISNLDGNCEIFCEEQNLLELCSGVEAGPNDWPMLGRDVEHTQISPSCGVDQPFLAWVREDLNIWNPIVVDGVLYGAGEKFDGNETVYTITALWEKNGTTIWSYDIPYNGKPYTLVYGTPCYYKGLVAVGSRSKGVLIFNADCGDLICTLSDYPVDSSPIAVNDKLYFGTQNGYVVAFDFLSGTVNWTFKIHGRSGPRLYNRIMHSSPAYYDGKLYVTAEDGYIYCLDSSTGELIWDYFHNDLSWSSPTIHNGKVFFGNHANELYALNLSNGQLIWKTIIEKLHPYDHIVTSPGILGSGLVVTSGRYTSLFGLNTGELIWHYNHSFSFNYTFSSCNPAVSADGQIFSGFRQYDFFCLNGSNGALIWNVTSAEWNYTSPVLYKLGLFFNYNNCLYKYMEPPC